MPWAGGGATKPPMANNYLDSHGLNPGTDKGLSQRKIAAYLILQYG